MSEEDLEKGGCIIKVDMVHPELKEEYKCGAVMSKKVFETATNKEDLLNFMLKQIKHDLRTKLNYIVKENKEESNISVGYKYEMEVTLTLQSNNFAKLAGVANKFHNADDLLIKESIADKKEYKNDPLDVGNYISINSSTREKTVEGDKNE